MFFMGFSEGQHVIAKRDLDGWMGPLGYPAVKKGTRGIVRATPSGWSDRYEIEFYGRGTVSVSGKHLKAAMFGGGQNSWTKYQQTRQGLALGMFILFGLPTCLVLFQHYMRGGSTAEIVAALPMALLDAMLSLMTFLGLPLFALFCVILYLRAKFR